MKIEVLFSEVCNLSGDFQNVEYLRQSLPEADFIFTSLMDIPYFAENRPDMVLMGTMTEAVQRRVIEILQPYRDRLEKLIDDGVVSRIDLDIRRTGINELGNSITLWRRDGPVMISFDDLWSAITHGGQ